MYKSKWLEKQHVLVIIIIIIIIMLLGLRCRNKNFKRDGFCLQYLHVTLILQLLASGIFQKSNENLIVHNISLLIGGFQRNEPQ